MALDARLSREGDLKAAPASVRLETLNDSGHGGGDRYRASEPDGSFFVKTPADRPIRFALLNEKGAIVRQAHGWFWIRRASSDLRRLPHGAGAVIAESSTCGATTHDDAERSLRRECTGRRAARGAKRQLRECMSNICREASVPSGAKARVGFGAFAARLKSCLTPPRRPAFSNALAEDRLLFLVWVVSMAVAQTVPTAQTAPPAPGAAQVSPVAGAQATSATPQAPVIRLKMRPTRQASTLHTASVRAARLAA